MHLFFFLAGFLLIRRFRKLLKDVPVYIKWQSLLTFSRWVIPILFLVVSGFFDGAESIFIGSMLLLGLLLYLDKQPDLYEFRPYMQANYPLVAAGLLSSIAAFLVPTFYNSKSGFFDFAIVGSFIWIFARWENSKKQQQELKLVTDRKAELEVLVAERTAELTQQKDALQETLQELKVIQAQLIQQEKLASLGELTAGIAHEIQNPLNFVNNFSEVSSELVEELQTGPLHSLPETEKENAEEIIQHLTHNLQKINHHGKRADAIVKGMLQHSRSSTGQKETTDLNAMADEYLHLSYHGLRAKDKSFNAKLETHFDSAIPKLYVVPQDIGRVLLNLFNNAFYAVQQKQTISAQEGYQPLVQVTTSRKPDCVELRVRDNGCGIPENIRSKIMQPFFTTKPTGQGIGLGLSLSYEIITKGHKGEITVESEEGEFTEFTIKLPLSA
ncbi:ATP-binding protein [Pontibacter sp. E15-1]|uniref:sensor histidine kinase n=1 Tax=Pontibacter sp. E15-1 TaxID=2919918 RepID=UPI001F4FBC3E|nr:ATP-binding protein [Pontibacter sp. E15-1]MCJ8164102.1 ATP-binding protein [Pontibacter sp. E15-1]